MIEKLRFSLIKFVNIIDFFVFFKYIFFSRISRYGTKYYSIGEFLSYFDFKRIRTMDFPENYYGQRFLFWFISLSTRARKKKEIINKYETPRLLNRTAHSIELQSQYKKLRLFTFFFRCHSK